MSEESTTIGSIFSTDALFNNPLFAGGLGLAGLGAAAAIARRGAVRGAALVRRRLTVNLEIQKTDPSYPWVLAWLSLARENSGFIASRLTRIHDLAISTSVKRTASGQVKPSFILQPGYGRHIVRQGNAYLIVNREKQSSANMNSGEPFETLTLTTLYAHRHVFEYIFTEAHRLSMERNQGKTIMYTTQGFEWKMVGEPKRKRSLDTVILAEGVKERIVNDVKDFMDRQAWYTDRGVPYRRGYLLYGPPGTGKSSFIQAIAAELDFGVASINLSERGMSDDKLALLMTKIPPQSILLLEDADAAFVNRKQKEADGYGGGSVTFSGLLNALDGVVAGEERIVFLTTNHIERLDAALIRPGRVDMTVRIGEATRYQAAQMWERFYGELDSQHVYKERFLNELQALNIIEDEFGVEPRDKVRTSTAAIQGLFLFNKDDMEGAIAQAAGLIPVVYEAEPDMGKGVRSPS